MASDNCQEYWRRYKRTRNLFWVLFLGIFPSMITLLLALATGYQSITPRLAFGVVFAALWFVIFLVAGNRLARWRCPRCGKIFSGSWYYNQGFAARKCVHCNLPKYAEFDPGH